MSAAPVKHKVLLASLHALSAAGWLLLLMLPAHKYAWMAVVDPSMAPDTLADPAGNRLPFTLVVAGTIITLQAVAAWQAQYLWPRLVSAVVALATSVLWFAKFGG